MAEKRQYGQKLAQAHDRCVFRDRVCAVMRANRTVRLTETDTETSSHPEDVRFPDGVISCCGGAVCRLPPQSRVFVCGCLWPSWHTAGVDFHTRCLPHPGNSFLGMNSAPNLIW